MSTASTDRRLKTARRVALLGLACLLVLSVAPASATAATTKPYTLDLGKRSDYVAQTNLVQCVGASMQMMLNMIEPGVGPNSQDPAQAPEDRPEAESAATRRA